MTVQEAKQLGFTHRGYIYNWIKVYAKNIYEESPELAPQNWFYGVALDVFTWFDITFQLSEGFSMWVTDIDN